MLSLDLQGFNKHAGMVWFRKRHR